MLVPYQSLPNNARVWIYQANRSLSAMELENVNPIIENFIGQWTRHGENVHGSYQWQYNQFLIVAVDQDIVEVSGCAIDASVKLIKEIESIINVDLMNKLAIAFKEGDVIKLASMPAFKQLAKDQLVNQDTIVFNNLVDTKEGVATSWEVPAKNSWHKRFF